VQTPQIHQLLPAYLEGQNILERGCSVALGRQLLLQRAVSLERLRPPRQLQAPPLSSLEHLHSVYLSQVLLPQILQSPLLRAVSNFCIAGRRELANFVYIYQFLLNPTSAMLQQLRPLVVASLACHLNLLPALRQPTHQVPLVIFSGVEVLANPPQRNLHRAHLWPPPPLAATKRCQQLRQTLQVSFFPIFRFCVLFPLTISQEPVCSVVYLETKILKGMNRPRQVLFLELCPTLVLMVMSS